MAHRGIPRDRGHRQEICRGDLYRCRWRCRYGQGAHWDEEPAVHVERVIGGVFTMNKFGRDVRARVQGIVETIHGRKDVKSQSLAVIVGEVPDATRQFPLGRSTVCLSASDRPETTLYGEVGEGIFFRFLFKTQCTKYV